VSLLPGKVPRALASKLLVASPPAFPDNKDALLAEVRADHSADTGWLDDYDLLDSHIFLHP